MLSITNLHVALESALAIVKGLNLTVQPGTLHAIMGPNGSGKSTLALTLMGHPRYTITQGSMVYKGQDLAQLSPDKRAKLGIFLAFQHPYEIPGVTVLTFLKEAHQAVTGVQSSVKDFKALLESKMELLSMDPSYVYRSLNDGFSGGEKKRLEMLQLLVLKPSLVILDEIDSGLDIDALKVVAAGLNQLKVDNPECAIIMITHYQRMLDYIKPDHVHVMRDGQIVASGDAQLAHDLEHKGYDAY
ncbi:MAG: Fe-S cluster assembly ATPase SufC [Candidatus Dependentiae bacterium]|nr:Fe-S cluster assembly ATPase SufC [Candidatus Dependentiae bacterium]